MSCNGYKGWEEEAPFDGIIVTAAATHIPSILVEQHSNLAGTAANKGGAPLQTDTGSLDRTDLHRNTDGAFAHLVGPGSLQEGG